MSDVLRAALQIIAEWKLPETGLFWDDEKTRPVSYQTEHGSDGVQRYMRGIACAALEAFGPALIGDHDLDALVSAEADADAMRPKPTNKMVDCSICEGDPDRCDIHDCGDAHNTVNPYRNADSGLYGPEYQGQQAEVTFDDVLKLAQQIRQSLTEFIERHP